MRKNLLLAALLCVLSATAFAQAVVDNAVRDGGRYLLYNVYYGRCLGGNSSDSSPALSAAGTNDEADYVWVAEASTLHSGYYWLRHEKTGKYLQASNAEGDTWSVWMAGSLNKQYNSYEWRLESGLEGRIISNRGEVINSSGNVWLGVDAGHEKDTYISVYYDKPMVDRSAWQIVSADAGLAEGRLALYVDDLNALIDNGQMIMDNPAYGSADDKYALAAALYNARNAVLGADASNLEAIATAKQALAAAVDNAREGNYDVWVSGSSFTTGEEFTVALRNVTFAPAAEGEEALPYCNVLVRGTDGTGALLTLSASAVSAGEETWPIDAAASHDFVFAFDGYAMVAYADGKRLGHIYQEAVPTMTACGQAAEWSVFGIKAMESYRPEIISTTRALGPADEVINEHGKRQAEAVKLVGQAMTFDSAIDYHISSETPMEGSTIDITNPDAWVIFDNVRPSDVIEQYLPYITINGAQPWLEQLPYYEEPGEDAPEDAEPQLIEPDNSGVNCRVAIYLQGAAIIPHSIGYEPFTGYTEAGYSGSTLVLGVGDHHELGEAANTLRGFVLKRGYMVTLANNADGSGYSRVYVADHEDKKISELPELLSGRVSFIFVRKWNYVSKKGWCGTSSDESMAESGKLLGATWFYSWSASRESQADMEFVPMQCHRYWPNLDEFYPKFNSTAMLLLNEPEHKEQHTSDRCSCGGTTDPWTACTMNPNYFHTGLRIGGPSPTDGSWLKEYIGHCNDMSYRCDFVGYHAYWGTNEAWNGDAWYSRLKSIYDNTKRPIWLTEWNNGASWTHETWPSSWNDQLDYQRRKVIEICNVLDRADFIERYTIFNLSEDRRKVLKWDSEIEGWWVTPAGEAYRDQHPTHAYNEAMQFVPIGWMPSLKDNVSLAASFNEEARTLELTVINPNGDNSAIEAVEYLNADNQYVELASTPRHLLDITEARSMAVSVDGMPADALSTAKIVLRLRVKTHRGDEAHSKRLVVNVPESLRTGSGIESVSVSDAEARFFNLQGIEVANPEAGRIYIVVKGGASFKAVVE